MTNTLQDKMVSLNGDSMKWLDPHRTKSVSENQGMRHAAEKSSGLDQESG